MSAWDRVIQTYKDMIDYAEIFDGDDEDIIRLKQDDIDYANMILALISLIRSQPELSDVKPLLTYYHFSIHLPEFDRRLFLSKPEPDSYLIWEGMKSNIDEVDGSRRLVHEDELVATIIKRVQDWRDLEPFEHD